MGYTDRMEKKKIAVASALIDGSLDVAGAEIFPESGIAVIRLKPSSPDISILERDKYLNALGILGGTNAKVCDETSILGNVRSFSIDAGSLDTITQNTALYRTQKSGQMAMSM